MYLYIYLEKRGLKQGLLLVSEIVLGLEFLLVATVSNFCLLLADLLGI